MKRSAWGESGARQPRTDRGSTSAVQLRRSDCQSDRVEIRQGGNHAGKFAGCSPLRAWQRQTMSRCSAPRSKTEMIAAQPELAGQTLRGVGEKEAGCPAAWEHRASRASRASQPGSMKHDALPLVAAIAGTVTRPRLDRPAPTNPQSAGGRPAQPREQRAPKPHSASTIRKRSPIELLQSPARASTTRQQAADGDSGLPSVDAGESIRCLSEAAMDCINSNFPASHLDGDHAEALSASARSVRSQLNSGSSRPKCP